ncbi:MAG: ATP-dependent DNA helicase, partial [Halobacteriovoraceae bacterium]|nr:ATP-dependent DNA helicase [Halobacteriovoraceae bacterium]
KKFSTEELWYRNLLDLSTEQLFEIAGQIDFDLESALEIYRELKTPNNLEVETNEQQDLTFNGSNIKAILQDEEKIKKEIPFYRYRDSQEKLALRIGQAFTNGIHALIQAPTGTGKTLGYLVPAALLAKSKKEQVLISTGTKALQNQVVTKDIPILFKMLGLQEGDLNVLRLVGSQNHYCELLYRNEQQTQDTMLDFRSFDERLAFAYFEIAFFYNLRLTDFAQIITRDNIPYVLKRKFLAFAELEKSIQVDYKSCTGHKCPFKNECTYMQGLKYAKEADLIIGNHSLLLSWPRSNEKPQHIIIDEAHKLESESTQAFTQELTSVELENFGKNLPSMVAPVYYLAGNEKNGPELTAFIKKEIAASAKMIQENIINLGEYIERYAKKRQRYTDIYWNEFPMFIQDKLNSNMEVSIFNHIDSLRFIFKGIHDIVAPILGKWELNSLKEDNEITAYTLFESFVSHIEGSVETLNNLLDNGVERAGSVKFHEEYGFILTSAPINVGELFYDQVMKEAHSVVFTSATLANHDGSSGMPQVEWMTGYNLLPAEKRFQSGLFLENNYDYKNNAKVYLCTDTPSLYDASFVPNTLEKLVPLIRDLGGRTLLLFSARKRFDIACDLLLQAFENEIPLFIQGLGKNVVEEFKKSNHGILIGMESFGEGIDIPGESLEFIYIDKIPDLRQDHVIQMRRDFYDANLGNEFNDYFLAHRTRALHQKLGRLIRREEDKGCVIVTDSRLARWKGRTLESFRGMMKPYDINIVKFDDACENVRDFLT